MIFEVRLRSVHLGLVRRISATARKVSRFPRGSRFAGTTIWQPESVKA
ncbi:hypothetical protein Q669_03835 [Labrenzia sp. C1B10]|nr:hypothetical protein Q669_03835 [Labrenzia sp. C1B10]ERS05169.1 hypothetical protein Q675_02090 [Labrenzia sp. C1B70]